MLRPRNASWLCAVLAIAGCAHAPPPPPPPPPLTPTQALAKRVHTLEDRAHALLLSQDAQVWAAWTQGAPLDLAKTSADTQDLFTPTSVLEITQERELASTPEAKRALEHLHAYFVGETLARQTADAQETFEELQASISFESSGVPHRLRDLEALLANEKSAERRQALYSDATAAVERLNPRIQKRETRVAQALGQLGLTVPQYGAELREVPLEQVAALADAILTRTQTPYLQVMERLAHAELQEPFSEVRVPDLPRLFRPEVVDSAFPQAQLMPRIDATLHGMGIDLATLGRIHLDVEERPGKNPRGLTLAFAPDDVRVSLVPAAGLRSARGALHELGHALHDAYTAPQPFELTVLGGNATSEGFAQLFEDLADDPTWLEQQAGLTGGARERFLFASAARKLFLVRRESARLLFAIAHHRDPAADPAALYAPLLERAYGTPIAHEDAERALSEEEELYAPADTLRAWVFAAQLSRDLAQKNGAAWWTKPEAGQQLEALWSHGTALTPEALVAQLGDAALDPTPLLERLASALHVTVAR